ncbi:MAG: hypothetical protein RL059_653 [Bacteroidota bacterium]
MVIKQEHIPAVQGIRAFSSQEQAQKAAGIIKAKLEQGKQKKGSDLFKSQKN